MVKMANALLGGFVVYGLFEVKPLSSSEGNIYFLVDNCVTLK